METSKIQVVSKDRCDNFTFNDSREFCTAEPTLNKDCSVSILFQSLIRVSSDRENREKNGKLA